MAKTLHPNQIHAISHGTGPMLVLAGPGSGKTTVIIGYWSLPLQKRRRNK